MSGEEAVRRKGAYSTRPHTQEAHTPLRGKPKARKTTINLGGVTPRKETINVGGKETPLAEVVANTRKAMAALSPEAQAAKKAKKLEYNRRWKKKREAADARDAVAIVNVLLPDWRIPGKKYKMSDKLSVGLPANMKQLVRDIASREKTSMTEVARRRLGGLFK